MAANTQPIYTKIGQVSLGSAITAAANDYTGAGANNVVLGFTAGADGSFVDTIRVKPDGTNVASVLRIYLNNGSANTSAGNNTFIGEITLPATTAIATAATVELEYKIGKIIPTGWRVVVGLGTAVSAGWTCTVFGGDY